MRSIERNRKRKISCDHFTPRVHFEPLCPIVVTRLRVSNRPIVILLTRKLIRLELGTYKCHPRVSFDALSILPRLVSLAGGFAGEGAKLNCLFIANKSLSAWLPSLPWCTYKKRFRVSTDRTSSSMVIRRLRQPLPPHQFSLLEVKDLRSHREQRARRCRKWFQWGSKVWQLNEVTTLLLGVRSPSAYSCKSSIRRAVKMRQKCDVSPGLDTTEKSRKTTEVNCRVLRIDDLRLRHPSTTSWSSSGQLRLGAR